MLPRGLHRQVISNFPYHRISLYMKRLFLLLHIAFYKLLARIKRISNFKKSKKELYAGPQLRTTFVLLISFIDFFMFCTSIYLFIYNE